MAKSAEPSEEARIRQARLVLELRSRGIANQAVLRAIERVPREAFLPDHLKPYAYDDRILPLPCGQQALQPFAMARMLEVLRPMPTDKILLIGLGLGYPAAVLSQLCRRVFAVERFRQLILSAETALKDNGFSSVTTRLGDGLEGWLDEGPFDAVLVTAGLQAPPEVLAEQCRRPARIVYPHMVNGALARLSRFNLPKTGGGEIEGFEIMSMVPALPGTARAL